MKNKKHSQASPSLLCVINALRNEDCNPKGAGTQYSAHCPAHDDNNPSLSVGLGEDGRVLLNCKAGCETSAIVDSLDLTMADLFSDDRGSESETGTVAADDAPDANRDWAAHTQRFVDALNHEKLNELAQTLGIAPEALRAIGCGFAMPAALTRIVGKVIVRTGRTFPERDGAGNIIGLTVRHSDDSQWALPGSERGLTIPNSLDSLPDPVLIVEGASDVAACLTLGVAAVGRPSNSGGVDHLATLIQDRLADREVIAVGENDAKPKDGSWPGRDGARKVAAELTQRLGREIKWAMPPRHVKDIRELLTQTGSELTTESARLAAGRVLVEQLASDSFRPPIESRDGRNEFPDPIPASALGDCGEKIEFVWEPYLASRHKTLLSAHPKDGKTTLLAHVVNAMGDGGHLVGPIARGSVLIVTEESKMLWNGRRKKLGIGDHVEFYFRFQVACNTHAQWEKLTAKIASLVPDRDYSLVIFDTFANVCALDDENDAAKMNRALRPLDQITEAGAAVLLIHHKRKGHSSLGQGSRGSSAFTGFVDVIVEMERHNPSQAGDCRRVLKALSRFDETPAETVIELRDGNYVAIGDHAATSRDELATVISELLPASLPGLKIEEIADKWPSDGVMKPGDSRLRTVLNEGFDQGKWQREGTGRKGSPHRFLMGSQNPKDSFRPGPSPIGGTNESNADGGSDG